VKENVMTTNRVRLFGGAILTGALLFGTAGLALAQDPTASPAPNWTDPGGSGMTGGQGMMTEGHGMTGGSGMMDSQTMIGAMGMMHTSMKASGTYDPSGR
jgi:hypothetical protein